MNEGIVSRIIRGVIIREQKIAKKRHEDRYLTRRISADLINRSDLCRLTRLDCDSAHSNEYYVVFVTLGAVMSML